MKLLFHSKQTEVGPIVSFRFQPTQQTTWRAGQSIKLELPVGYGAEERRFTISSPPHQQDIVVTTRVSDSKFKQALNALQPGAEVNAYNIEGAFTWDETAKPKILCASGVGITPFRALLQQQDHLGESLAATLLYSSGTTDFLFTGELLELQQKHPKLEVLFLPQQRLSAKTIAAHCPDFAARPIYLSGPSAMVDDVGEQLVAAGLPQENLKKDWFTGRLGWDAAA